MSLPATDPDGPDDGPGGVEPDPLGPLPTLTARQARLSAWLARGAPGGGFADLLAGLGDAAGPDVRAGPVEVLWHASGLHRPGLTAQLTWPRLTTRLALGIETPVAHALVDRLLGFDRLPEEGRLQLTPVEWGIGTFLIAQGLARLVDRPGPLGVWDLSLDRVGPDPFDVRGLGRLVTLRWPVRVGPVAGAVRLWLPETLVGLGLSAAPPVPDAVGADPRGRLGDLAATWRAEAGLVALPRGLARLRAGVLFPLFDPPFGGTPESPRGPVELVLAPAEDGGRAWFPAEPIPLSGGGRLTLTGPLRRDPTPREALAVNPATDPPSSPSGGASPADVPVTLTVELGRVSLALRRLADLRPGDVIELGRHSREPVELTSGGRLVARGELVQIDTELGVRITNVFL